MERIIWTHQSGQPFYVFDEEHIVHFWDDGVSIHHVNEWYMDVGTSLPPFASPHVYPKALPLEFYRSVVLNDRLPISLALEGENLGTVKGSAGYNEPDIGSCKRRIVRQKTELRITDSSLIFGIEIHATPVDPKTVRGSMRDEDKLPQEYRFGFAFPLEIVPEVLDLTETQRRTFQRNHDRPRNRAEPSRG